MIAIVEWIHDALSRAEAPVRFRSVNAARDRHYLMVSRETSRTVATRDEDKGEAVGQSSQGIVQSQVAGFELPATADFRTVAVGSLSQLLIGDRARVSTPSGGFATTTHAGTSIVTYGYDTNVGAVVSLGSVKLLDRARVNGSLTTGNDVTYAENPSSVVVTGGITQFATLTPLSTYQWKVPFNVVTSTVTVTSGTTSLAPGSYGSVTLQSGGLKLRAGTYYIDRLTLEPNTAFTIDSSAGPVYLYVRTALIFRTNMTGAADKLLLGYFGTQLLALERPFFGTVVAPNARVRLAVGNTPHSGAVLAKEAELDPGVNLTFRAFAHWNQIPFVLTPRFDCVENRPDGTRVAVFGYSNPGAIAKIPVGTQNQFVPTPQNRLQPTTFLPGSFDAAVSVGFSGTSLKWSLSGSDAVVDVTRICPSASRVAAQADATVKSASARANFGTLSTLSVAPGEFALLAFDRQALLNQRGPGRLIRSARLEVEIVSGSAEIEALPLQKQFVETAATWNCANDQDVATTAERCHNAERWSLPRRPGTYDNPYDAESVSTGAASGSLVVFDITDDVGRFLTGDLAGAPVGWILQPRTSASSVLGAREGAKGARLVIDTVAFSNTDLAGATPFSLTVDTSLATSQQLPAFADGVPRRLAVLQSSDGDRLLYAENELIVMTDNQTEIDAIKARWAATEVAAQAQSIPGIAKGRVLRIDTSRADPATLVPNLKRRVNRPDGLQKVSSDAALRLLAAAAAEMASGTLVGVNWVAQPGAITTAGFGTRQFVDGQPSPAAAGTENSSNAFEWDHLNNHRVPDAWKLLHFAGKMKPAIDVAVIDAGFCTHHQDIFSATQTLCASGCCANPFDCGGGGACPWHGLHVANAGFGEPNNSRSGAGPGSGVTDLTLYWGFGDMGTLLITIPALVLAGEDIMNSSTWIPVPDWLFFTTLPAEAVLRAARKVSGRLIFSISGNANKNVDRKRCYNLGIGEVCPWEETTWFPCESDGVHCVGGTNYADKSKASFSNFGKSVRYYATGTTLTSSDPGTPIGDQFQLTSGTSLSSPFVAGIAALTWAARTSQGPGDVEACLSAARSGGPDGRFVDAFFAAACGLGSPPNLAPLVEITNPAEETANFGGVAPIKGPRMRKSSDQSVGLGLMT